MLSRINLVIHLVAFIMVATMGNYAELELIALGVCLAATWMAGHFALKLAGSRGNGLGLLTMGLVILFWVAYTSKLALAMLIAGEYWVVPRLISETALLAMLPEAYFLATVGYVTLLMVVLSFPPRHRIHWRITATVSPYGMMLSVLSLGLVLKYISKGTFSIGVPGLDPVQLGVPYLAGVLALTFDFGFLFFANVPFFKALASGQRWGVVLITLTAAMANAIIDLRFGSKDTLMYQLVLIFVYFLIVNRSVSSGRARARFRESGRAVLIVLVILGPAVLASYKYMNAFRFASLYGASIQEAVSLATNNSYVQSKSSIVEIYNRITGIEALTAAADLSEYISSNSGLLGIIDGSPMKGFSDVVMLGAEGNSAFSMSLTGYLYVVGGVPAIVLGSLFTGILFGYIQFFVVKATSVSHNMKLAFLPILWIMFVHLMLGGNPLLWVKSMMVTLPIFFFIGRINSRRERVPFSKNVHYRPRR